MQNFLELKCLVDDLIELNILFDEVDQGLGHEKNILLDTVYISHGCLKLMACS